MNKHQQQSDGTRQVILDVAYRLYMKQGVEKTTMQQIAREAGTHRTNVYRYFRSHEEIGFAITEPLGKQFLETYMSRLDAQPRGGSAWERLAAAISIGSRVIGDALESYRFLAIFDAYLELLPHQSELAKKIIETHQSHRLLAMYRDLVAEGIADGSIRPDLDPEITALALRNALLGVWSRVALRYGIFQHHHNTPQPELIADTTCDLLLTGVRNCCDGPPEPPSH